jgi:hypothetical protein
MPQIDNLFKSSALEQLAKVQKGIKDTAATQKLMKELKISFKGAVEAKNAIDKLNDSSQKQVEKQSALVKVGVNIDKISKQYTESIKKLNQQKEKAIIADKKRADAIKKSGEATLKRIGQESRYFKEIKKATAATRAHIKATKDLVAWQKANIGSVGKAQAANRILEKRILSVADAEGKGAKRVAALNRVIDKNNAFITKNSSKFKRLKRSIGEYERGIGRASKKGLAFGKNLLAAAGATGGLTLLVGAFKGVIGIGAKFEKSMSTVRAVSGATDAQMTQLTNNAKELGATTEKTAAQVSELQIELAKLGLSPDEILASTDAILDLSTAAGADLAQSAKVAASTMKGFGLEAKDIRRITDVMAKSFSASALDLSKFETAMASVAPVAKNAGVSIEETTANLALLTDRGLDASTAGTSLRNIYLDLSKQGLTLDEAMKKIRESTDQNATAMDLFGKRGATTAVIMANNEEEATKLTKTLEDAAGSTKIMADIMRDNLSGDADAAKSALEGLALQMSEKNNPALRASVQGFTKFIQTISGTRNKAQELNDEFNKQNDALANIEDKIPSLVDEYDTLISKENLTTEEQERLNEVIQEVTTILPGAANEFDAYGVAIGISTDRVDEAVLAQRNLAKELKGQTIDQLKEQVIDTAKEFVVLNNVTKEGNKLLTSRERSTRLQQGLPENAKATNAELQLQQSNLIGLGAELEKSLQTFKDLGLSSDEIIKGFADDGVSKGFLAQIETVTKGLFAQEEAQKKLAEFTKSLQDKSLQELTSLLEASVGAEKKAIEQVLAARANAATKEELTREQQQKKDEKRRKEIVKADKKLGKIQSELIEQTIADEDAKTKHLKLAQKGLFADGVLNQKEYNEKISTLDTKLLDNKINSLQTLLDENKVTGDRIKDVEDELASFQSAKSNAILNTKIRNNRAAAEEEEKLAKATADALIRENEREYAKKLENLKNKGLSDKEYADAVFALNQEIVQDDIDSLNEILANSEISAVDKLKIQQDLKDKEFELHKLTNDKKLESDEKLTDKQKALLQGLVDVSLAISDAVFAKREADRALEVEAQNAEFEEDKESLLKLKESGAITEEEYTARSIALGEKQKEEKNKLLAEQAKAKRNDALWQIGINTIVAASTTLATLGLPAAIPALIAVAAAGVASVIAVASKPLPAFEKGVKSAPGGLAKVSEKGPELGINTDGSMFLTPPTESIMDIKKGTEIIPHHKVLDKLQSNLDFNPGLNVNDNNIAVIQAMAKVESAINNQVMPESLTDSGIGNYVSSKNRMDEHIEKRFRHFTRW